MLEHTTHYIDRSEDLILLAEGLDQVAVFALDIETIYWWDREAERVSLIQLALRTGEGPAVYLIDALSGLDIEILRRPLELGMQTKAIHNASFDAVKLMRHYGIATSPIHDTMLAARRSGERSCSLKVQAERHLGISLDKAEQRGDWARRPLSSEQIEYAALDALCTLLLYEKQSMIGLTGDYRLKPELQRGGKLHPAGAKDETAPSDAERVGQSNLTLLGAALLGIVVELDGRYSPEQLTVSVGRERIGVAGWLIDRFLGSDADVDESDAQQEIEMLCRYGYVRISESRRLEATDAGRRACRQTTS